jgi:hypothetical protein
MFPKEPVGRALSGGTYVDGSEAYVGIGVTRACSTQTNIPGRISTTVGSAGVHIVCGNAILVDNLFPSYLEYNPRLTWVNVKRVTSRMNVVTSNGGFFKYHIGRINLTASDTNISYQQIGQVYTDNNIVGIRYVNGLDVQTKTADYDVLVCA